MRRHHLGLLLLPLLACADRPADPVGTAASPDSVSATVELTIGTMDDPDHEFGRISGLAADAAGRIYVADALSHDIRVYASGGEFLYRIGREGGGPGELSAPCCIAFDDAGRLYARDGGNHRYNIYQPGDTAAAYVGQVEMPHGDVNRWADVGFDREGRLIDIGTGVTAAGERRTQRHFIGADGRVERASAVHEVPADSTGIRQVQRQIPQGMATLFFYQPYGPGALTAFARNGDHAHALSSRYAIDWRDAEGVLRHHIVGATATGPELSVEEREIGEEEIASAMRRSGRSRLELGFEVPDRKPVLRALHLDVAGRLWVELSVPYRGTRLAHVYDTDGRHVQTVSWPADVRLSPGWIGNGVAYGIRLDSLDVPSVVRLRF